MCVMYVTIIRRDHEFESSLRGAMNCWKWKKGGVLVRVSFAVKRHQDQETLIKENFFLLRWWPTFLEVQTVITIEGTWQYEGKHGGSSILIRRGQVSCMSHWGKLEQEDSNPALTVTCFFQHGYTFFNKTILASPYTFMVAKLIQIATGRNYYKCNVQV